ncbi:DNA topology modulation protein [Bacillaceae bacterium W0354]
MDKIILIGSPGSGKSTMARRLETELDIELYHLDNLFWKPGWINIPIDEQREISKELVQKKRWMIDGNYNATLPIRLEAADTVIFFDLPRWICMLQIFKRRIQYWNKKRPDFNGGKEKLNLEFINYVWRFRKNKRPKIVKLIESIKHQKDVYTIRSRKEYDTVFNRIVEKGKENT